MSKRVNYMSDTLSTTVAPTWANAVLLLSDRTVIWGRGVGAQGIVCAELCFNTAMTGYQEVLSDPSYAEQMIVFTASHVGNVGWS
jgi:carbamoyl-phosphate synthase small subunit